MIIDTSSIIGVWNEVLTLSVIPSNVRCGLNGSMPFMATKIGPAYSSTIYLMYLAAESGVIGCQNTDMPADRFVLDFWF